MLMPKEKLLESGNFDSYNREICTELNSDVGAWTPLPLKPVADPDAKALAQKTGCKQDPRQIAQNMLWHCAHSFRHSVRLIKGPLQIKSLPDSWERHLAGWCEPS